MQPIGNPDESKFAGFRSGRTAAFGFCQDVAENLVGVIDQAVPGHFLLGFQGRVDKGIPFFRWFASVRAGHGGSGRATMQKYRRGRIASICPYHPRHAAYLKTLWAKVQLPVMSELLVTHYLREIRAKSQKIAEAMRRESTHA